MGGFGADTFSWGRGAVERGGNGSNRVRVGAFTPAGCMGAPWASGDRGCSSAPEDGPSFGILGDVGGSQLGVKASRPGWLIHLHDNYPEGSS